MDNEEAITQIVNLSNSAERLAREIERRVPRSNCEIHTIRSTTYERKLSIKNRRMQYSPVKHVSVLIELFFISDGGIPRRVHREFHYNYEPEFMVDINCVVIEITEKIKEMVAEALLLKYDNLCFAVSIESGHDGVEY